MSALRTVALGRHDGNRHPILRRLTLVWVVKRESVIDLYREDLAKIQSLGTNPNGCQIDVIIHATLSEKEDEDNLNPPSPADDDSSSNSVLVDMVGTAGSSSSATSPRRDNRTPFMRFVMGYGHGLVLTICSGGGFFLGIFLANFLAAENDRDQTTASWYPEYRQMLQLFLGVLFASALVGIGMSGSLFRTDSVRGGGGGGVSAAQREGVGGIGGGARPSLGIGTGGAGRIAAAGSGDNGGDLVGLPKRPVDRRGETGGKSFRCPSRSAAVRT